MKVSAQSPAALPAPERRMSSSLASLCRTSYGPSGASVHHSAAASSAGPTEFCGHWPEVHRRLLGRCDPASQWAVGRAIRRAAEAPGSPVRNVRLSARAVDRCRGRGASIWAMCSTSQRPHQTKGVRVLMGSRAGVTRRLRARTPQGWRSRRRPRTPVGRRGPLAKVVLVSECVRQSPTGAECLWPIRGQVSCNAQ